MKNRYAMLGYDEEGNPFVEPEVTTDRAKVCGRKNGLTGFLLTPQPRRPRDGGMRGYERREDNSYGVVKTRAWVAYNLLDLRGQMAPIKGKSTA